MTGALSAAAQTELYRLFPLLSIVFAIFGYRISSRHQLLRGVTPWRLPSAIWALICFLIGPIGLVVEFVAEYTTRPALPASGPAPEAKFAVSALPTVSAPPSLAAPSVPQPAPPPADGSGKSPLFGWYADVTGRHALRYWDGRRWSELVADDGTVSSEPI